MTRGGFGAVASEPHAAEGALQALQRGGTAVDACIAGFLSGAAVVPGMLLGPVQLLVVGPGAGMRHFDGSVLQPGKDAPRPRGFRDSEPIPVAARVGVTSALAALSAAHAHDGVLSMNSLASAASKIALASANKGRAVLIRRIGQVGPMTFRESSFVRSMLEIAGRANGGNLTQLDCEEASGVVQPPLDEDGLLLPVGSSAGRADLALDAVVVAACDARGVMAVLHTALDPDGVEVPVHEVTAPRLAEPVRRGVPRVAPGARLSVPAPIGILAEGGVPWACIAAAAAQPVDLRRLRVGREHGITLEQRAKELLDPGSAPLRLLGIVRGEGSKAALRTIDLLVAGVPFP